MKTLTLALALAAAMLATGCESTPSTNDDRNVSTSVGKTFDVTLKSNPTTGYQWQVAQIDKSMLEQVGTGQYTPHANTGAVGAGGTETFTFKALKPGETNLLLAYRRPWEKDKKPANVHPITVRISK